MSKKNRSPWHKNAPPASPRPAATVLTEPEPCQPELAPFSAQAGACSDRRAVANHANAQLSTGPRTSEGRAKSSLNALKSGLTGQTVLLPTDDVAEYERHIAAYFSELSPVGRLETDLVESIAQTVWRLKRIPTLEAGIYALGQSQLADEFADHDPALRPSLIEVAVHLKYEKQFRNLQLQESRLERRREKQLAELRTLQQQRLGPDPELQDEEEDDEDLMNDPLYLDFLEGGPITTALLNRTSNSNQSHEQSNLTADVTDAAGANSNGFEFSNANSDAPTPVCEAI